MRKRSKRSQHIYPDQNDVQSYGLLQTRDKDKHFACKVEKAYKIRSICSFPPITSILHMSILGAEKTKYLKNFFRDFSNDKRKKHTYKKKTVEEKRNTYLTLPSSQKTSRPLQPQTCNGQAPTISPFNYPSSSLGPKSNLVISYQEKLQGPMALTHLLNVKSPSV